MAKNRKIPFGYMMQNGSITPNPKEVLAVVTIFRSYLNGESLVDIAKAMEVPYNEGVAWNKNMVKRIIENEKYLGTDKYPQLIDEDTFHRANAKKEKKALSLCVISEELQQVRNLTFCKECGHRLFRQGGNTRSEKWDCRRKECYPLDYRLTDQMLIGAILNVLNSVIANPSLLESSSESSTYSPTANFVNELKTGSIRINKQSEDNQNGDRTFTITGNGETYTITTGADGIAILSDIPVYNSENEKIVYTISEKDVPIRYVTPANQTATLTADATVDVTFENVLKKFTVEVVKKDIENGTAQGDASLAGAVYGIYNGDELIDTYTTDEYGSFTTHEFECGDNWTIKELTPSEGYRA